MASRWPDRRARRPCLGRAALAAALLLLAGCGDSTGETGPGSSSSGAGGHGGAATTSSTTGSGGAGAAAGGGEGGGAGGPVGGAGGEGGAGGDGGAGGTGGEGGGPVGTRVRIVAANLTSGTLQSYDPGHGIRILQGIAPDVILLQEFNYGQNSAGDLDDLVVAICGIDCEYVRGPDAEIPNGIVSRYPLLESGSWTDPYVANRTFVWARIDVPGDVDLHAISVHLLGTGAANRALEATAISNLIDGSLPSDGYLVLGGDFNTDNRSEQAITTFDSTFDVTGPYPADQAGIDNTSTNRSKPYDWVLADDDLQPLMIPVLIGNSSFDAGAVIDTRVYQPLSEIAPAQLGDSDAFAMQHMAVIKDFALP